MLLITPNILRRTIIYRTDNFLSSQVTTGTEGAYIIPAVIGLTVVDACKTYVSVEKVWYGRPIITLQTRNLAVSAIISQL